MSEFDPDEPVRCEGCGEELPAFLDACPYCDGEDEEGDVGVETLACPECGVQLYEEAQQCFACGAWVTLRVGEPARRRRLMLLVAAALVVILTVLAVLFVNRA
ncbi:MAG: hypothetical protein R3F20_12045 [Planctomycetota bacterium]